MTYTGDFHSRYRLIMGISMLHIDYNRDFRAKYRLIVGITMLNLDTLVISL